MLLNVIVPAHLDFHCGGDSLVHYGVRRCDVSIYDALSDRLLKITENDRLTYRTNLQVASSIIPNVRSIWPYEGYYPYLQTKATLVMER